MPHKASPRRNATDTDQGRQDVSMGAACCVPVPPHPKAAGQQRKAGAPPLTAAAARCRRLSPARRPAAAARAAAFGPPTRSRAAQCPRPGPARICTHVMSELQQRPMQAAAATATTRRPWVCLIKQAYAQKATEGFDMQDPSMCVLTMSPVYSTDSLHPQREPKGQVNRQSRCRNKAPVSTRQLGGQSLVTQSLVTQAFL